MFTPPKIELSNKQTVVRIIMKGAEQSQQDGAAL